MTAVKFETLVTAVIEKRKTVKNWDHPGNFRIIFIDAEVVKRKYNARLDSVQSVAEAYPNDDNEQNDSTNNREQTDLEYGNGSPLAEGPVADSPVSNVPQSVAQDVSVSSGQSPNPSIQLDEDDDDRYNSNRRPSTNDRSNTYFPITFGSTNGGAIAIANAFSNGKGGSALSRATAYGSPSKKRVQ